MIREARCQGSVTVFFALTLTLILAVICTTLESARYSLLSYFASQAQGAAVESVFAGYYRPLWENYHLLFMADSAGLEAMVEKELAKAGERAGPYGFQVGSIQAVRAVTAVDQGGAAFLRQVRKDGEAHGLSSLLESMSDQATLIEEGEEVFAYVESLSGYGETISQLEEEYRIAEEAGRSLKEQVDALLEGSGGVSSEQMEALKKQAQEALELCGEDEALLKLEEQLAGRLKSGRERLEEQKSQVSASSYEMMEKEFLSLEEYASEGGRSAEAGKQREMIRAQAERILGWSQDQPPEELLNEVKEGLPAFSERKATASEEPKLLEAAKDWKGGELLALLTDESTLSDGVLKGGPYPSEISGPAAEGLASKAAAAGYMTEHFGRYGSEGESELLVYEAEYILGGKASDRENLEYVAGRLMAVRTGLNFLYLMGDQAKRAEAEALAAGLVGFTGIAPLVRLASLLILGAWSLAEALEDVRLLLSEGSVPLIKEETDWKLSLSQAYKAFGKGQEAVSAEEGTWDYEAYLALLFLLGDGEKEYFRMMDVIEWNLRKEDAGFFMENCLSFCEVQATVYAEPMFLHLPFGEGNGGRYELRPTAAYGYQE